MLQFIFTTFLILLSFNCNLLQSAKDNDTDMLSLAGAYLLSRTNSATSTVTGSGTSTGTGTATGTGTSTGTGTGTSTGTGTGTACTTNACKTTCYGSTITTTTIDSAMPSWIANNFACVKAYKSTESGVEYYVFETEDVPPHKSPYWGTTSQYYEAMPTGNTQQIASFVSQSYKFKIPVTPTVSASGAVTAPGVAAGVAVNGVVLFFGQASPGNSLSSELSTFDSAQGHPDGGSKRYHYHALPKYITDYETKLLGIMSDGYPVYGSKEEDGTTPSTTTTTGSTNQYPKLNANTYGHSHATADFPSGTFHYHITNWDSTVNIPSMPVYTYGTITISNITY